MKDLWWHVKDAFSRPERSLSGLMWVTFLSQSWRRTTATRTRSTLPLNSSCFYTLSTAPPGVKHPRRHAVHNLTYITLSCIVQKQKQQITFQHVKTKTKRNEATALVTPTLVTSGMCCYIRHSNVIRLHVPSLQFCTHLVADHASTARQTRWPGPGYLGWWCTHNTYKSCICSAADCSQLQSTVIEETRHVMIKTAARRATSAGFC